MSTDKPQNTAPTEAEIEADLRAKNMIAMEYIWERVPKTKEGLIHYLPGDIPYLYKNGFVDTQTFDYATWKKAFEDCKQKDDSYLINREKFMSLSRFRYVGPVFSPFDSNKLREGEWTDPQLKKLYDLSIKPSSGMSEDFFFNHVKTLKGHGFVKNGNLVIDSKVKGYIGKLIEQNPSPRRLLETEVARIKNERDVQLKNANLNREKSQFVVGKGDLETKMDDFKKLESKNNPPPAKTKKTKTAGIDIKSLKKPSRKITG